MANPGPNMKKCTAATRAGRLTKAKQFWEAAELLDALVPEREEALVDAYITLCVHAGIAAADVICCARLGRHAKGQDHDQAIALLASVDKTAARHLAALLGMKTRAGYSDIGASPADRLRARRAAQPLLDAAERAV